MKSTKKAGERRCFRGKHPQKYGHKQEVLRYFRDYPGDARHYIDLELLKPAKVLANGYREFSIDNAVEVFYLRHERGLGASLNQFHPENEAENLADQDGRYQENLLQLQKQKALLERQIERNIYYRNLIQRAIHQKGQPLYLNVQQLFSLSFLEFSPANLDRQNVLKMIEKWMQFPELLLWLSGSIQSS